VNTLLRYIGHHPPLSSSSPPMQAHKQKQKKKEGKVLEKDSIPRREI